MKLLRLKINSTKGFRSLKKGFEIYFLRDFEYAQKEVFNPYLLAGRNGSGKSNVLEALAEIFYHLDGIYIRYKPDYFEKVFKPKKSRVNAYELEYVTYLSPEFFPEANLEKVAHISIIKKSRTRPFIKIKNLDEVGEKYNELSQQQIKSLLPEYVVGYASGHNETLSIPFFKSRLLQYDEYLGSLESQEFVDPSPESSLVFLDAQFSQAIALTCMLMFDDPESDEPSPILAPFREYVQLQEIDSFRLIIRTNQQEKIEQLSPGLQTNFPIKTIDDVDLIKNLELSDGEKKGSSTRSYIEKLKRCATCWDEYDSVNEFLKEYDEEEMLESPEQNHYIVLDFKVTKATKRAFQLHFEEDPLKLFEFFQLSIILNNYIISKKNKEKTYQSENPFINNDIAQAPIEEDRILRFKNVLLQKSTLDKTIFTKNLSDGEHQFIHTLGLSLLFRNTRSLFLLDEPETHFNPDWKAKYISSLRSCFAPENIKRTTLGQPILRDMLITTHSPFLISDSNKSYVYVFKKDPETLKLLPVNRPDFQTLGTSVNKIGIRIFGMPHTIGEYAQKIIEDYKAKAKTLTTDVEKEVLIKEIKENVGDSVEQILLINEIINTMDE